MKIIISCCPNIAVSALRNHNPSQFEAASNFYAGFMQTCRYFSGAHNNFSISSGTINIYNPWHIQVWGPTIIILGLHLCYVRHLLCSTCSG